MAVVFLLLSNDVALSVSGRSSSSLHDLCYFHAISTIIAPRRTAAGHACLQQSHEKSGDDASVRSNNHWQSGRYDSAHKEHEKSLEHYETAKYHRSMVEAHHKVDEHTSKYKSHREAGMSAMLEGNNYRDNGDHEKAFHKYTESAENHKLARYHDKKATQYRKILEG